MQCVLCVQVIYIIEDFYYLRALNSTFYPYILFMARKKIKKSGSSVQYKIIIYLILILFGYFVYKCGGSRVSVAEKIDKLEIPVTQGLPERTIVREGYTLSYNPQRLIPNWVAYELTSLETQGDEPRGEHFKKDPEISGLQAETSDYRNSGWDKGHMAPAADMKWSERAMDDCFYLTNICPQDHKLNTGTWKKLEERCREYARYFGHIYIVCGPIVENNRYGTIGDNGVMVPDGFFKVILAPYYGEYKGVGFLFENRKGGKKIVEHAATIDEVERVTGIDFFPSLPDDVEDVVEAEIEKSVWNL